jgi:TRAP-type C4-dicarboxylate transport system permease large subunit
VDARKHKMGALEASMPRPPFWKSLREASWGLAAPVLILGGMRMGWFTPPKPPWWPCSTACSSAW